MHKLAVKNLEAGMRVGQTIHDTRGDVLLASGVELTEFYLNALRVRGFHYIYIQDGFADDAQPVGLISEQLRMSTLQNVHTMYKLMAEASQAVRDEAAASGAHVIPELKLDMPPSIEHLLRKMDRDVEGLLSEALGTRTLAGIASLKSHDNYTFEHSVDVAFYGVILGRRLGLDREYLKDLALGCLLHDIGKTYVDGRILNKPGRLEAREFEAVQQHTVLGFQMVRQMPISSPRPAHVALQHHERQDGCGYPNRLFGTNKISRTDRERFDRRRITLLAELAAVADVCSALASDRPYRPAMPAPNVVAILREYAGKHLNSEALDGFLLLVQVYPIGQHVRVIGGTYDGCYGIVVRCEAAQRDRPDVRLLVDAAGQVLPEGMEINLRALPGEIALMAIPETGVSMEEYARTQALAA